MPAEAGEVPGRGPPQVALQREEGRPRQSGQGQPREEIQVRLLAGHMTSILTSDWSHDLNTDL